MYLWNTKALAKELKEGTLSESEKFKYYIVTTILYTVLLKLSTRQESTSSIEFLIGLLIIILIIFFGTYICYVVNKSGDNVNFIERFICLTLPIAIKISLMWVLIVILGFASVFILGFSGFFDSTSTEAILIYKYITVILIMLAILSIWILFYWRIYVHMKWISHDNTDMINS